MGEVTSEIDVAVDPRSAFEVAREVERYPDFMSDVNSVEVLERRDDGYTRVAWSGQARVASIDREIRWIEEEWWDPDTLSARFGLVEGDYKRYEGDWGFTPIEGGTRIRLRVDFDLGLPLIGPLIVKLLDRVMQNNLDGMLRAIKDRLEREAEAG